MEHSHVREVCTRFEGASAIFGVGGGSALDHAKYAAWLLDLPLVLVPTILSVDAAFTRAIGVREGARVRYVGEVVPDYLLVDYSLLRAAPPLLNRAGVGDILSIFTAIWDWRVAADRFHEAFWPEVAASSDALLERLLAGADDLRDVTREGLRLLAELYVGEVRLCDMVGSSRPEEGSEHYLAYCLESMTGRSYLHGQLVSLCVVLVGVLQGQDVSPVTAFLERVGLDWHPEAVGVSREELLSALCHARSYVRQEAQLLPGVFHFRESLSRSEAEELLAKVLGDRR
jgi:glycerol-1-phosphate dehydrogenase [NAD(P)+]